jgi:hypothetical protein
MLIGLCPSTRDVAAALDLGGLFTDETEENLFGDARPSLLGQQDLEFLADVFDG